VPDQPLALLREQKRPQQLQEQPKKQLQERTLVTHHLLTLTTMFRPYLHRHQVLEVPHQAEDHAGPTQPVPGPHRFLSRNLGHRGGRRGRAPTAHRLLLLGCSISDPRL